MLSLFDVCEHNTQQLNVVKTFLFGFVLFLSDYDYRFTVKLLGDVAITPNDAKSSLVDRFAFGPEHELRSEWPSRTSFDWKRAYVQEKVITVATSCGDQTVKLIVFSPKRVAFGDMFADFSPYNRDPAAQCAMIVFDSERRETFSDVRTIALGQSLPMRCEVITIAVLKADSINRVVTSAEVAQLVSELRDETEGKVLSADINDEDFASLNDAFASLVVALIEERLLVTRNQEMEKEQRLQRSRSEQKAVRTCNV